MLFGFEKICSISKNIMENDVLLLKRKKAIKQKFWEWLLMKILSYGSNFPSSSYGNFSVPQNLSTAGSPSVAICLEGGTL